VRVEVDRNSVAGESVFGWSEVDREKAHAILDMIFDVAEDATDEKVRIEITDIRAGCNSR